MASSDSIIVGNYTYTAQDAQKTISALADLWKAHTFASSTPDGWLAGARGFVAEAASLAGVALPSLDNVDSAFAALDKAINSKYKELTPSQRESLIAAMWRFFPTMRLLNVEHVGTVAHMHASKGLPKKAIDHAAVGWSGIQGDVQTARAHHGRPWQALCIWSTDSIDRLRDEGHPIGPGFAGENITVAGIPNTALRPGAHFLVGSVRGFITDYAWPCSQNNDWFIDRNFMRMCHEQSDDSRVYAMVTKTGEVSVGDTFTLYSDR